MELSALSLALTRAGLMSASVPAFSPGDLFTTGVNGAWYDPSDLTTLFQDAAGTTPVTAVEQPVGRMLDKSGRGNHAVNNSGNSANFPLLSSRYNLLTKTEQFDDTAWNKVAFNYSANTPDTLDPIGGNTADFVYPTTANVPHAVIQTVTGTATSYVATIAAKTKPGSAYNWLRFGLYNGSSYTALAWFNVSTGQVGTVTSGTTITPTNLGNGWWMFGVSGALAASASCEFNLSVMGADGGSSSYAGDGTSGIYIWGADLRAANDALNQPAYQRVNTSSDYDTVGFKPYLRFNDPARGTNNWLQTNSIDFTATDKMFVCAGVRKLSATGTGMLAELSLAASSFPGTFYLVGTTASNIFQWRSWGTSDGIVSSAAYPAPYSTVLSGIGNISGDVSKIRVNGTESTTTTDQGTGNYGNHPLYLGARAGTSLWANIRFYGAVIAGKQASAAEITNTETFINQKTGAY